MRNDPYTIVVFIAAPLYVLYAFWGDEMKQLLTKGANALKTGQSKSEGWSLDGEDLWKIIVSCLIVGGGAALTAFEQQMSEQDFGMWTTAVMAVNTVLVNLARKFLADNSND